MIYIFNTKSGRTMSTEPFINGNCIYATAMFATLEPIFARDWGLMAGLQDFQVAPGLFSRYPDSTANTQVDDYLALTCIPQYAKDFLAYGRRHLGFYDVTKDIIFPKGAQWLFRFQGLWQHAKLAAGEKLGLLGQLIWAVSLRLSTKEPYTHQDAWIQPHLMVLVFQNSQMKDNKFMKNAVDYWFSKKQVPTSDLMESYCGDQAHPLVLAWKGRN